MKRTPLKSHTPLKSKTPLTANKPLQANKPINKIGKKTRKWNKVRKDLTQIFYEAGIVECELRLDGCWKDSHLTFAHLKKRRNLTEDELTQVALLCLPCHEAVEKLPESEMTVILQSVINERTKDV